MNCKVPQEPVRDETFYRSNAWMFYMLWLRGEGREAEARQVCEEALEFHPSPRTRFLLSVSLWRQGLREEAVVLLREIIAEQPDHASAHVNLGAILIELGFYDEAITALEVVPQISPKHAAAYDYMGRAYYKKGDLVSAIRAYRAGLAVYEYPDLLAALGDTLRDAGQVGEALEVLRDATANFPNAPITHLVLGKALRAASRVQEALQEWKSVLTLVEEYVEAPMLWEEDVRLHAEARLLLSET